MQSQFKWNDQLPKGKVTWIGSTKPPIIIISNKNNVILNQKQTEYPATEKSRMLFASKNLNSVSAPPNSNTLNICAKK
jgi:hypothetical protein